MSLLLFFGVSLSFTHIPMIPSFDLCQTFLDFNVLCKIVVSLQARSDLHTGAEIYVFAIRVFVSFITASPFESCVVLMIGLHSAHAVIHARIALTGSASLAFSNSVALALETSRFSACRYTLLAFLSPPIVGGLYSHLPITPHPPYQPLCS